MPAPNAANAWERIVDLIVVPSAAGVLLLALAQAFWGDIVAGFVLNIVSLILLVGIALKATYWNTEYTGMIAIAGTFLFFITPSILSVFVHPAFAVINMIIYVGFLLYIWMLFLGKLGIDIPRRSGR